MSEENARSGDASAYSYPADLARFVLDRWSDAAADRHVALTKRPNPSMTLAHTRRASVHRRAAAEGRQRLLKIA